MNARPKHNLIRVNGVGVNATRTDMFAGPDNEFSVVMDEPPERHGNNEGMWPLHAFMSGYAGCTNVIMNIIAKELGITFSDIKFGISGYLDPRGYTGAEKLSIPFSKIRISIDGRASGNVDQIENLKSQLTWRCPAAATLYAAGIEIEEDWRLQLDA